MARALREVGAQGHGGAAPASVALAWASAKGTTPIPGARTVAQARSNLASLSIKLSDAEVARLDAAAARVTPVLKPETNPFPKKAVDSGLVMYDS